MDKLHAYMRLALEQANLAYNLGEVPVGAIIVHGDDVIAVGHNMTKGDVDPTAHAEIIALRRAALVLGSDKLIRCDMYVTLEPCPMCAQAISISRIRRLYFGAEDVKSGGVVHGAKIFYANSCHHIVEFYGGILEEESSTLLRHFFANKRSD